MWIVGAGRIGGGLAARARAAGIPARLVDRESGWDALAVGEDPSGPRPPGPRTPIVVATRTDDLAAVVPRVPPARRADLVFVQNGAIREVLRDCGLTAPTRGVLYVMAARRGDPLVPGATSWFAGPRAEAVAAWFRGLGLPAEAVSAARFGEEELEKLLWLSAFGALCDRLGLSVAAVAERHAGELAALVAELAPIGRAEWGVALAVEPAVERMRRYALALGEYRASVKEWRWRDGWLRAKARAHGIPTPLHDALAPDPAADGSG